MTVVYGWLYARTCLTFKDWVSKLYSCSNSKLFETYKVLGLLVFWWLSCLSDRQKQILCKNGLLGPLGTLADRDIYFASVNFCFQRSHWEPYLRIYWTDLRNLSTEWKHFGCKWSIWTSFSNISRDVAMATNFVENGKLPSFVAIEFRTGMGYRYLNVHINSVNDASISCKIS